MGTTGTNTPFPPEAGPGLSGLPGTVYTHLRAIAAVYMRGERVNHTLTATALVHEAFVRMRGSLGGAEGDGADRGAFVRAAAQAMRHILVDHARSRARVKRGGGSGERVRVSLDAIGEVADLAREEQLESILAFDEAFASLERHDERFAEVVRLRFYAGLSVAESAAVLGVSERTVNNDWTYARAWLARELLGVTG